MKKWLWISFFLSLFLSITLIYTMVQNKQLETSLNADSLSDHTYIPVRDSNKWQADREEGYYLFTGKTIDIKTFRQKTILHSSYKFIGNGVFQLEDNLGFMIRKKDTISFVFNSEQPLIFKEYQIFDK